MSKSDSELFTQHEHALENAHQSCPKCDAKLTIKNGKSGTFLGCTAYPSCNFTRPVLEQSRIDDKVLVGSECPKCGHELAVKQGRYGMFIGCSQFPMCQHIEQEQTQSSVAVECPSCETGHLVERQSRFGKTFYACNTYPKCKYAVNHEPVDGVCQQCGFTLLVKRKMAAGEKLQCPQKKCGHFQTPQG